MINVASRYCLLLFKTTISYGRCQFSLNNSGHFLCVPCDVSGLPVKLFCIFAFESGGLLHSNRRWWVDKIRLHWIHIGGSVLFNRYSCVTLQYSVLSLVMTILSFLFMLWVGIVKRIFLCFWEGSNLVHLVCL